MLSATLKFVEVEEGPGLGPLMATGPLSLRS
jgi:hypothetical protein